jgi:ADP-ribose pyrophosphatase YjhB (NUDIX family)
VIKLKQIIEGKDSKDAAGIAYFFNDTLLCCQNNKGRWGIPKGHIHIDETPEEGALRELSEETQIILNKPIEFSHKAKKKNGGDFNVFMCKGDKKFIPHLNHEHMDWGYFSINELPTPFDDRVIKVVDNVNESMLVERIDYHEIASQLVKTYKLKSKVKITSGKNKGDYEWKSDVINLRPNYSSIKEFLITVLHEIHHALQRKKMGAAKYEREYYIAGELAQQKGKDFHDDNQFEEDAEEWGKKQYMKWKNKF